MLTGLNIVLALAGTVIFFMQGNVAAGFMAFSAFCGWFSCWVAENK
jgi:hypothetical protein